MLKRRITKKLEEMKNGGYTLFSDKVRKMLIAMGLSLLSIGTLSQVANAQVTANVIKKSGEWGEENKTIRYQILLEENNNTNNLEGIYYEGNPTKIIPIVGDVSGKKAMIVIEVPSETEKVILKNDKEYPEENIDNITINLKDESIEEDNQGPKVVEGSLIKYVSSTQGTPNYIQAKFEDATKIYRIEDQDGYDRVMIKEKDKENEIVLKYILEPNDTQFTIYDILGNSTIVALTDVVQVSIDYNTRNIDGTQVALKVTREFGGEDGPKYTLTEMKTGAGESITPNVSVDDIVYTNIPAGTTKLLLIYESEDQENKIVEVPLILDKDAPVVIAYKSTKMDDIAYLVEESQEEIAKARAYFNKDKKKGIVEVRDVKSGIYMIKTLKGKPGSYQEEAVEEAYKDTKLQPSVLCVFPVTEETTAVRIYDGVKNTIDIPLGLIDKQDAITVATIIKEDEKYKLVAQDIRAGLGKITRENAEIANFEALEGTEIEDVKYEQYTLKKFKMTIDAKGNPVICVHDAIGNVREVSFDEIAYACHYATFNTSGSLAISVEDLRGISKITATMTDLTGGEEPVKKEKPSSERLASEPTVDDEDYEEKKAIWNEWVKYDKSIEDWEEWNEQHRHTYILEVFGEEQEPEVLTKTYQIPAGVVEEVRVYNTKGDDSLYNVIDDSLINISDITPSDRVKTTSSDITKNSAGTQITGAKVKAKFGIKKVQYDDGCIVRFYDELPTELYVNCLIANQDEEAVFTGAVVTDALGDTLIIENEKVMFSYNNSEINI